MTGDLNADRAVERLARAQHGVFNHEQVVRAGLSKKQVYDRVRSGTWLRLAPGIYSLASAAPTWRRKYKAAELTSPHAALAGFAAARLHGFEGFPTVRPEIVVPYTTKTRSPLTVIHRNHDVVTTRVDRIRVTTVAQTLFDLLARTRLDRIERCMDGQLLSRGTTIDDLIERRTAYERARKPGIGLWRALVEERTDDAWAPTESDLEAVLWRVLRDLPGDPGLVRQASLPWWEPGEGRVDTLASNWRTIIEADGRRWHARVRDFDADRWRDNVAVANGYRVLRFTHTHLRQRPDEARMIVIGTGNWRVDAA